MSIVDIEKLTDDIKTILEYANSKDSAMIMVLDEHIAELQAILQERYSDMSVPLEQLHALLQLVTQLGQDGMANKLAETLHSFADQLNQSPEALGQKMDEFIAKMEQDFGALAGSDKTHQQERIYQEARASAKSAIAASLQAHGFTPFRGATSDVPSDKETQA